MPNIGARASRGFSSGSLSVTAIGSGTDRVTHCGFTSDAAPASGTLTPSDVCSERCDRSRYSGGYNLLYSFISNGGVAERPGESTSAEQQTWDVSPAVGVDLRAAGDEQDADGWCVCRKLTACHDDLAAEAVNPKQCCSSSSMGNEIHLDHDPYGSRAADFPRPHPGPS